MYILYIYNLYVCIYIYIHIITYPCAPAKKTYIHTWDRDSGFSENMESHHVSHIDMSGHAPFFGPPHVLFVAAEAVGLAVAPTTARRILHLASGDNSSHDRATNQLDSPGMPLKNRQFVAMFTYVYICLHMFTAMFLYSGDFIKCNEIVAELAHSGLSDAGDLIPSTDISSFFPCQIGRNWG